MISCDFCIVYKKKAFFLRCFFRFVKYLLFFAHRASNSTRHSSHVLFLVKLGQHLVMNEERTDKCPLMKTKAPPPEESRRLITLIYEQTMFPKVILWSYFYWWVWFMCMQGFDHIDAKNMVNAVVLASFLCIALNAAAYSPPLLGPNGYIHEPFKILRFWLIPFCVSSISVVRIYSIHSAPYTVHRTLFFIGVRKLVRV